MKEVKPPKRPLAYYYGIVLLIIILFNIIGTPLMMREQVTEVRYSTFMKAIENQKIDEVQIEDNRIVFTEKDKNKVYETGIVEDPDLTQRLYDSGARFSKEIENTMSPLLSGLLSILLPLVIFIALGQYMSRKLTQQMGGKNALSFGMGKSNAKLYVQSTKGIRFSDVVGEDEAKENLAEIVDYLHDPDKYTEVGATMPRGVLLVGPPGTGKTMLAKAVAGESGVPFFSISGSEFVEMFVGMGASKVRDLFKQAKEKAPCIVFIDEIDAIGKKRNGNISGNDEREQTLNQLLTEMDGFDDNTGVIILAATNQPDSLDPALTRPGRFDRRVPVELPDLAGREAILKVHAKKIKMEGKIDFHAIARMASGASGAELANIINEAALRAVRNGRNAVIQEDLEESIEEEYRAFGAREKGGGIPRDRTRSGGSHAEPFGSGAEDNHYSEDVRCAGIYDAGRPGRQVSPFQGRDREQDSDIHRRPCRRGSGVRRDNYGSGKRYRAGDQTGQSHDNKVRDERSVRYGRAGNSQQSVSGRRYVAGMLGRYPERDRQTGSGAGEAAA